MSNICYHLEAIIGLVLITMLTEGSLSSVAFVDEYHFQQTREATVIIHFNNQEGGICWNAITDGDAKVLCRQNGDSEGKKAVNVGVNATVIRMMAPGCDGSEDDIMNCPFNTWGDYDSVCDRQLAARIECDMEEENAFLYYLMHYWTPILQVFALTVGIPSTCYFCYIHKHKRDQLRQRLRREQQQQSQPLAPPPPPPPPPPSYQQAQQSFGSSGPATPQPLSYVQVLTDPKQVSWTN